MLPLGAAIAFKMTSGAIATAAVAAIMTTAMGSVFVFIVHIQSILVVISLVQDADRIGVNLQQNFMRSQNILVIWLVYDSVTGLEFPLPLSLH